MPDDPLDRLEWQRRAAEVGAYRELYGYEHPDEPIGPEPTGDSPEKRSAWHSAFAALGPVDGVDLRSLPDGSLLHMRGTYEAETAWAPRHVGRELQRIRISADDASLGAIRAQAEEGNARQRGHDEVAGRHGVLARSYASMETFYREQETELAETMEVRREWERATEQDAGWQWPPAPSFAAAIRDSGSSRSGPRSRSLLTRHGAAHAFAGRMVIPDARVDHVARC